MTRKAQAAMEYLMTYGWAILIVIVVVAALYAMGVFKIGGGGPPCSPCFANFAYMDYASGTLAVRNGPEQRNITSITSSPVASPVVALDASSQCALNAICDVGKDIKISGIPATTGSSYILTLQYTVVSSGLVHTDTATIRNP